jgi:hypothetical protein
MFERYNEQARRAIFFARWWALNRAAAARIEAKDLVLGIVHEKPADGSPYLQLYAQREALTGLFAAGIVTVVQPAVRDIPLSDDSKRALAYAAQEADRDGREAMRQRRHWQRGDGRWRRCGRRRGRRSSRFRIWSG